MTPSRILVWPIAAVSYLALLAALLDWLSGAWSGATALGLVFAVTIGIPTLAGYAGNLWWRKKMQGLERVEVIVGLAFPVLLLAFAGLVTIVGRT